MPASVTIKKRGKFGNGFVVVADVTFDDSYPTGGEALTAQQFGLTVLDFVLPSPASGYLFEFDHANKKLKAFTPTVQHTHDLLLTGGQAAGDAIQVNATVVGKTAAGNVTAAGGVSNIQNKTAAAATEVADTTNLSAVTVRVIAIGI